MADRVERLDAEDVQFIVGAVREAKAQAAGRVAATPAYMREARAGAEAARERADRIARTLDAAKVVTVVVPESGGEG